ncbi:MAG: hypothetical protein H5T86_15570 [Armatimonadetes bacterium]|nr:hypothetical protein [Armatimonadota bacterium]
MKNARVPIIVLVGAGVVLFGYASTVLADGTHDHSSHNPALCHELKVRLDAPAGPAPAAGPVAHVGKFPIALSIISRGYGVVCGHGVRIYLDMVPVHRNENVTGDRYTWTLDLEPLGEGLHYIVANVCDHHDHIGVASMVINVQSVLLPGLGRKAKVAVPVPPGRGVPGGIAPPGLHGMTPPAFDTALQATAVACCGGFGDWPVAADCTTTVPVPGYNFPGGPVPQ